VYLGGRERVDLAGRTAIVVDDGIATGATMRAALQATRARNPDRLVLAVPVAPTVVLATLRKEVDDLISRRPRGLWRNRVLLPGLPAGIRRRSDRNPQEISSASQVLDRRIETLPINIPLID
jgi:hypothetical protein